MHSTGVHEELVFCTRVVLYCVSSGVDAANKIFRIDYAEIMRPRFGGESRSNLLEQRRPYDVHKSSPNSARHC